MGKEKGSHYSKIYVLGLGPGSPDLLPDRTRKILQYEVEAVVGYRPYLETIAPLLEGKKVFSYGMQKEMERTHKALELAAGGTPTALVSSGDAGIYGMAGPLVEMAGEFPEVEVEVVPGITAASSAAALLGAPLMNDFAVISLSDLLVPWEDIKKRVEGAAAADFVIVLYNPRSRARIVQLEEALEIISHFRSPGTPAGIVHNAWREKEAVLLTTLKSLKEEYQNQVDMNTTVIIGSNQSYVREGQFITPRGYGSKYPEERS